jgi:hypothetical protein
MKFLLLNQFGYASGAPTGRILAELGSELERRGHRVFVLTSDSSYGGSRRGLGRLFQEGFSHLSLFAQSFWNPKVDVVISLTSPACLAVTAAVVAKIHRARHFPWVMDAYPEVGVRLGELKDGPLVRLLTYLMNWAYQNAARVVTLDEDMRDYFHRNHGIDSTVIGPFPPEITWPVMETTSIPTRQWLYSGNFGRAHEIEALLEVQKKLEQRQVQASLILQGQGPQFLLSQQTAAHLELRQVKWREPVPVKMLGESLLHSEVLVVTRKAELKGLLLPSKLLLAELSGRRILWIGDTDGATAQRLSRQGRHGVFAVKETDAMAEWLHDLFTRTSPEGVLAPTSTSILRQQTFEQWDKLLCDKSS